MDKRRAEAELVAEHTPAELASFIDYSLDPVVESVGKAVNDILGGPGTASPWDAGGAQGLFARPALNCRTPTICFWGFTYIFMKNCARCQRGN